jgi:IS1 family transposase
VNGVPAEICTSHVERQNLNMRTASRRLTRLTIGFSNKLEHHTAPATAERAGRPAKRLNN